MFQLKAILLTVSLFFTAVAYAAPEDTRLGNIALYKRTFKLDVEECMKNIPSKKFNHYFITCSVKIKDKNLRKNTFEMKITEINKDIISKNTHLSLFLHSGINHYYFSVGAYKKDSDGALVSDFKKKISKQEFKNAFELLVKENGDTISTTILKLE